MRVLGSCDARRRGVLRFDSLGWDVHDIAYRLGHLEFCIGLVAGEVTYTTELRIVLLVFDHLPQDESYIGRMRWVSGRPVIECLDLAAQLLSVSLLIWLL